MRIAIENILAILPEDICQTTSVYIDGDTICAIGSAPEGFVADKTIQGGEKLLSPGFVNAHTHVYMTGMRNRADDLNFMDWLFKTVMPIEETLTQEEAYYSIQLGLMEMLLSGTTCLNDMHIFPLITAKALADCGFRGVLSRGLVGDAENWQGGLQRLKMAEEEINAYKHIPTLEFMLAPHAPYTCDEKYLRLVAERSKQLGVGLHSHLSESSDEQEKIKAKYGCSPAQLYDRCGVLTEKTVLAHCVYLSDSDIELLAARGSSVAHNPASNMKLGNGFAPVSKMLAAGVNVALGTDGCCSNNNQSMLREMQLAALIHKGTDKNATAVTAKNVFDMATINGAKALGLGESLGEIKVGKKADLCIFSLSPADEPGFFPLGDAKAALCYASAGLKAETVIVNGQVLLQNGEFMTMDVEKIRYEVGKLSKRLDGMNR